jgi:hypothetical protein
MKRLICTTLLLALFGPAVASGSSGPEILRPGAVIGTVSDVAAGVAKVPFREGPWHLTRKGHCVSNMYHTPNTYVSQLDLGPGHYPCNALPWQNGTVILSGHRVTHTTPFDNLGNVRRGQTVRINTKRGLYLYRIMPPPKGHHYIMSGYGARTAPCIHRQACGVLAMPPPGASAAVSFRMVGWIFRWNFNTGHWLILLACNPKHDLTHRIAVFAKRVKVVPPQRKR